MLACCQPQDLDKPLDELIRAKKKTEAKKKTPAKKKAAAKGTKKAPARKAKASGAAGKLAAAKKKKTPAKKAGGAGAAGKWKHDMYKGGRGAIKKKAGRGAAGGRGRGRGGGRGAGGGRGGAVKETTITKKTDGTWDIKLAPGDEGKCIYVGNIPGAPAAPSLVFTRTCAVQGHCSLGV